MKRFPSSFPVNEDFSAFAEEKRVKTFFCFSTALLLAFPAAAWETDNYTCNKEKIRDSRSEVNAETNRRIKKALEQVNSISPEVAKKIGERFQRTRAINRMMEAEGWDNEVGALEAESAMFDDESRDPAVLSGRVRDLGLSTSHAGFSLKKKGEKADETEQLTEGGCSYSRLETTLETHLASAWMGNMETWADQAPIPKCQAKVDQSVFSAFSLSEGPVAQIFGLNPVININGHKLGIDKLSHFMTEGLHYARVRKKGGSLQDALAVGIREEEGGYGWSATGVKSYGDMSANYKGSLFWGALVEGDDPYFQCRKGKWVQLRDFDWADYVDDSLNESINCSEFKTADMNEAADKYTEKLYAGDSAFRGRCPVVEGACSGIVASIQPAEALKTVVHPKCLKDGGFSATSSYVPGKVINSREEAEGGQR